MGRNRPMAAKKGRRHEAFGEAKTVTEWARDPRCRVSKVAIGKRLRAGWELERALTVRIYDDNVHEAFGERMTLKDWSKDPRCVVTYGSLQKRVSGGKPLEQAMTTPADTIHRAGPKDDRIWLAFGEGKTLAQWTKDPRCAVCRGTLQRRLEEGVDPETAITSPRAMPPFKCSAFGETKRLAAWARDSRAAVSYETLYQRLEAGWDFTEALTTAPGKTPPSGAGPAGRRRIAMEAFCESKTIAEWARDPRCLVSDALIRQRLQKGWTLEEAMTTRLDDKNLREAFGERKTLKDWAKDPRCVATYHALVQRVHSGRPLEQAMAGPMAAYKPGPRDERIWHAFGEAKTIAQWLKDPRCMAGRGLLVKRLDKGMDPEMAIRTPRAVPPRTYSAYGETKTLATWAKDPRAKVSHTTMYSRLEAGWDFVQALITPPLQEAHPRGPNTVRAGAPVQRVPGGTAERLEAFGERKTLREWAADPRCSISYLLLRDRLMRDWPIERAIAEVPAIGHRNVEAFGESKSLYAWQSDPRCLVSEGTLRKRMNNGESLEEAMTRPPDTKPRRRRYFDWEPSF